MEINIPEKVHKIITGLESQGFEAFAVGGCVRDAILGREPEDWDITTNALPEDVKKIFSRTIDTGLQHGTVTVLLGGERFEVTTYRIDGVYSDGRHPDRVIFTPSLKEDLSRRDFTINALAYNPHVGLVDEFDGISDLHAKVIRCVGDASTRFKEDALRMMRAIRFSAVLGFEIEGETYAAIRENASLLEKISAERILTELTKTLVSPHPEAMRLFHECGLTRIFMPEFDTVMACEQHTKHHIYTVGVHTIEVMKGVRADKVMRLSALMHDFGKPKCRTVDPDGTEHFHGHPQVSREMAGTILRRLKSDNDTIEQVKRLVEWHDARTPADKKAVRRLMSHVGSAHMDDLLELQRADVLAQSMYQRKEKLQRIEDVRSLYEEIRADAEAVSVKDLAIDGRDLMAAGVPSGPEIGRILRELLEAVLDDPTSNTREALLERAAMMY